MPPTDIDRNLLFGVLALQRDMIDQPRYAEACSAWALAVGRPLAGVLIERGWITEEDRRDIERDIERKVRKHRGDRNSQWGGGQPYTFRWLPIGTNSDSVNYPFGRGFVMLLGYGSDQQQKTNEHNCCLHDAEMLPLFSR